MLECDATSKKKLAALKACYMKAKAAEVKGFNLLRILCGACKACADMNAALAGDDIDAAEARHSELKAFEAKLNSITVIKVGD